jgi:hypothetical protein
MTNKQLIDELKKVIERHFPEDVKMSEVIQIHAIENAIKVLQSL